jgi:hypothetical protein
MFRKQSTRTGIPIRSCYYDMADDEFAHVVYSAPRHKGAVEMHRSYQFIRDCELQTVLSGHLYPLLTYGVEDGVKARLVGP